MSLERSVQPCASGRHGEHVVTIVNAFVGRCEPQCEASQYGRRCSHVKKALAARAEAEARDVETLTQAWRSATPAGRAALLAAARGVIDEPPAIPRLLRKYDSTPDDEDEAYWRRADREAPASAEAAARFRKGSA